MLWGCLVLWCSSARLALHAFVETGSHVVAYLLFAFGLVGGHMGGWMHERAEVP